MIYKLMKKRMTKESVTFRIDSRILEELRRESEHSEVSLNTVVNQILKQHIDWHAHAAEAGYISVQRMLLVKLLERITDEDAIKLGTLLVKTRIKDSILLVKKAYDLPAALDMLESWLKVSGIAYRHQLSDTRQSYILQHNMGRKWSLLLAEIIRYILEEVTSTKCEFETSDNTLIFSLYMRE